MGKGKKPQQHRVTQDPEPFNPDQTIMTDAQGPIIDPEPLGNNGEDPKHPAEESPDWNASRALAIREARRRDILALVTALASNPSVYPSYSDSALVSKAKLIMAEVDASLDKG